MLFLNIIICISKYGVRELMIKINLRRVQANPPKD